MISKEFNKGDCRCSVLKWVWLFLQRYPCVQRWKHGDLVYHKFSVKHPGGLINFKHSRRGLIREGAQ